MLILKLTHLQQNFRIGNRCRVARIGRRKVGDRCLGEISKISPIIRKLVCTLPCCEVQGSDSANIERPKFKGAKGRTTALTRVKLRFLINSKFNGEMGGGGGS
jgi:hypothetical protein